MRKEFVMRGKTASGATEVLNFGKYKQGTAYRLTEFQIYPSLNIPAEDTEATATITAGKTAVDPQDPDFLNGGLIATTMMHRNDVHTDPITTLTVINDTFLITQNLILMMSNVGGSNAAMNWQCKFESVKMTNSEEAANNYKQFMISDE